MKTSLVLCLMAMSIVCFSQESNKSGFTPYMMHGIGASFQEFEGLNSRISSFPQYKELRDHMGTLQLGWLKQRNRFISGLSFTAGSSMSGDRDERSSTIRYLGVNKEFGYNVLTSDKVMLYPLVGIGYERYQAKFFKDNSAVDFNNVLESSTVQNNIRPVDFKNSFLTYRAGFGVTFRSPKMPSHAIGLHAGYTGSFRENEWRSTDNQELKDSPEDRLGRIFVSLVFLGQPKFMKHK